MITGAHVIIYSTDAEADRAFFRDVLDFPHVDVGGGWLIFRLPPSELAVHPHDTSGAHAVYLMCDELAAARRKLTDAGVETDDPVDEGWGILTAFRLPGGSKVGLYQPRHASPD